MSAHEGYECYKCKSTNDIKQYSFVNYKSKATVRNMWRMSGNMCIDCVNNILKEKKFRLHTIRKWNWYNFTENERYENGNEYGKPTY